MHKDRIICNALIEHHYRMATYDVRDEKYLRVLDATIQEYRRKVHKKESMRRWWRALLGASKPQRDAYYCFNCSRESRGKNCRYCKTVLTRSHFAKYPSALD
ncbi:hypothetical protein SAMN05216312_12234 [Cohnella sp. OV330]|uniref:hypothetical protein n=1 Tax=Cohnella sp. OV330 TaxID=1855288 RepID=UPI0008F410E8|nr:hypothetical protein [Cohnella sp. OV330]SFB62652.1 hypothetical protein SAMN05216312_12234 [Cohnella sp. OV330]